MPDPVAELFRYAAFISYSSKDARFAARLHRALEDYRIPAALGPFRLSDHPKSQNRLFPIFRDREELPSGDLGAAIERALRDSAMLIVVCSPNAAHSEWVDREIHFFDGLGRANRIFAVIAEGEPHASETDHPAFECLPEAFRTGAGRTAGEHSALAVVAGDARRHRDGFRAAWLKVVAGAIGVNLGRLIDRDRIARRNRALILAACATLALVVAGGTIGTQSVRSDRVLFRERAAQSPGTAKSLRYVIAATRDASDILPSAPTAEAMLLDTPLGALPAVSFEGWVARLSPDGTRLLTWQRDARGATADILLRDAKTLETIAAVRGMEAAVFSPASDRFVIKEQSLVGRQAHTWLYDSDSGRPRADLGVAITVRFTGDGARILAMTILATRLYDAHSGMLLGTFEQVTFGTSALEQIPDVAGSAVGVGPAVLTRDGDEKWTWRDSSNGRPRASLGRLAQVTLSEDGTRGVTIGDGPASGVLRNGAGGIIARFSSVSGAFIGGDGLATVSANEITIRDARTGAPLAVLDWSGADTSTLHGAFNRSGDRLVVWNDSRALLIDGRTGGRIASLPVLTPRDGERSEVTNTDEVVFSPDGRQVLAKKYGRTALYDATGGRELWHLDSALGPVVFSPDGRYLLTQLGLRMRLLDARSGTTIVVIPISPTFFNESVQFSADSRLLLVQPTLGGEDGTLFRLGEAIQGSGAARREAVCRANYDIIGPFPESQRERQSAIHRDITKIFGDEARDIDDSWRLRGRPWHPCDWRGTLSLKGWEQALRYWAVRAGADWDYASDECTRPRGGFGCPARR